MCFDRGGWSPELFADIIDAGFDLLTYRKNEAGQETPPVASAAFAAAAWTGDDGRSHGYDLADTTVDLTVSTGTHKAAC